MMRSRPGLAAPLLDEGDTLLQIGVYPAYTVLLLQNSDGGRRVRVSERNGRANVWRDSVTLDSSATLDLFHAAAIRFFWKRKAGSFSFAERGGETGFSRAAWGKSC